MMNKSQHNPYDAFHEFCHKLITIFVLYPYYFLRYKCKILGRENLPPRGKPFIIICNHFSYSDPTIVSLATERAVAYVAKQELFDGSTLDKIITFLGAIPINREKPGPSTIKKIKEVLGLGWPVGIFIEGTRNQSRETLSRLESGAAFLARLTGKIDVLPIGIKGGQKPFDPLTIKIGKIIPFDASKSIEEMTLVYGQAVADLAELKLVYKSPENITSEISN